MSSYKILCAASCLPLSCHWTLSWWRRPPDCGELRVSKSTVADEPGNLFFCLAARACTACALFSSATVGKCASSSSEDGVGENMSPHPGIAHLSRCE